MERNAQIEQKSSLFRILISVANNRHRQGAAVDITYIEQSEDRRKGDGAPVAPAEFNPGFRSHAAESAHDKQGGDAAAKITCIDFSRAGNHGRHGTGKPRAPGFIVWQFRSGVPHIQERLCLHSIGTPLRHRREAIRRQGEIVNVIGGHPAKILQGVRRSENPRAEKQCRRILIKFGSQGVGKEVQWKRPCRFTFKIGRKRRRPPFQTRGHRQKKAQNVGEREERKPRHSGRWWWNSSRGRPRRTAPEPPAT